MIRLYIKATYTACTSADIDFPIDKWEDVVAYCIRYDTLYCAARGMDGNHIWAEIPLENATFDIINWHRPSSITISDPHTGNYLADES